MATIVLASASGAPGTTVTALGLALVWPREVLLVDADRSAGQAVLAGHLRGTTGHGRGLQAVLTAHRERSDLVDAVLAERIPLPGGAPPAGGGGPGGAVRRDFLPGFTHLAAVDLFDGTWSALGELFRVAPFDVLVDAGRLGHRGLPTGLVEAADLVLLVCRSSLVSLAGVRVHVDALVEAAPPGRCGLALVGPGRPYRADEVAAQFGVPVLAQVPWAPRWADELAAGEQSTRWHRSPLARSLAATAAQLRAATTRHVVAGVNR